ncbi:hypothetical protein Cba03nite_47790 [Catellatospora bangladeshensis]|uniref:Uncharacterized protein n=1 Tax=Catellatospora bangladeshensis TaxID=310355 RepID=A0A8J3JQV7_9ACTN|nr:hypothetical protein Cba03nite_47790 [Catellatospora bangladeshensis]
MPPVLRLMAAAGLPTAGGEIGMPDIAIEAARSGSGRVAACLTVVEELLAEEGDAPYAALKFLEALQNVASHGVPQLVSTEELMPLRGPRTIAGWAQVEHFWQDVVDWCDGNGVDLQESEPIRGIDNQRLRSLVWPAVRTLPDGRAVDLSHVVQYELAVGVPMA